MLPLQLMGQSFPKSTMNLILHARGVAQIGSCDRGGTPLSMTINTNTNYDIIDMSINISLLSLSFISIGMIILLKYDT